MISVGSAGALLKHSPLWSGYEPIVGAGMPTPSESQTLVLHTSKVACKYACTYPKLNLQSCAAREMSCLGALGDGAWHRGQWAWANGSDCGFHLHARREAQRLFAGKQFLFLGNSVVRHMMYAALNLLVGATSNKSTCAVCGKDAEDPARAVYDQVSKEAAVAIADLTAGTFQVLGPLSGGCARRSRRSSTRAAGARRPRADGTQAPASTARARRAPAWRTSCCCACGLPTCTPAAARSRRGSLRAT